MTENEHEQLIHYYCRRAHRSHVNASRFRPDVDALDVQARQLARELCEERREDENRQPRDD
jgi:hypothetical protein